MYALFEDAGKFLAGRVMSEADSSLQVELDSGKRVKVKSANVLLKFEQARPRRAARRGPAPGRRDRPRPGLGIRARRRIRLRRPRARLLRRQGRRRRSRPRRCSACSRRRTTSAASARAGSRRRRKRSSRRRCWPSSARSSSAAQIDAWAQRAGGGRAARRRSASSSTASCSSPTRTPPSTRPWSRPRKRAQRAPLDLLKARRRDRPAPYQFHWRRFLFEHFPKGTAFPALAAPAIKDELPLAGVQAFSIDDSATTEIDDALSVQGLGSGTVVFGIHIAAPGLAIAPDSAARQGRARARCPPSTCRAARSRCCPTTWCRPTR